jgi:hypothetical protein
MLRKPAMYRAISRCMRRTPDRSYVAAENKGVSTRTAQVKGGAQDADVFAVGAVVQPADPRRAVDQARLSADAGRIVKYDRQAGSAPMRGRPA